MSAKNMKVAPPDTFYDDSAYMELPADEFEPAPSLELRLESFTKDVICTKCGMWRSEHDYDFCTHPNYTE